MKMPHTIRSAHDERTDLGDAVAALDQRVVALDREIAGVSAAINALRGELSRRFEPQWQNYIAGAAFLFVVFGGFWAAGITPIKDEMLSHTKIMETLASVISHVDDKYAAILERRNDLFLQRREHEEYKDHIRDRLEKLEQGLVRLDAVKPTVGELKGVADGNQRTGDKLEARVRDLEIRLMK